MSCVAWTSVLQRRCLVAGLFEGGHMQQPIVTHTPLRVGVIGLGVGEQHAIGVTEHPRALLVALCDSDAEKLTNVGSRFPGVRCYSDAHAVLKDPAIDLVVIATYDDVHAEHILTALAHGKHVFVEKPLATSVNDAVRISAALRAHPHLRLTTNTILRASARFQWVKAQCDAGAFGELYAVEADYNYGRLHKVTEGWRGRLPFYSAVYGGGIHAVDLLRWFTGDDIVRVYAVGNQIASRGTQFRYRDCITALLEFRRGMFGKIGVNYGCVMPHVHPVTLYGTKATFVNDLPHGRWYTSREPTVPPTPVTAPYPGCAKHDLLRNFISAVLEGCDPIITEDDAFRTMATCFAIEESADRGEPVDVLPIVQEIGVTPRFVSPAVR